MKRVSEAALQDRYAQALALQRRGDLAGAEALCRGVLAQMPRSFHALHLLGVLRGQHGDWPASRELIVKALAVDPGVAAAHANLGNALRLMGDGGGALASYDRALQLQPDNIRALKGRGQILWQIGRSEEALACYEHLLGIEPGYSDGWIMKAASLDHLGRKSEAIAAFRKALEFEGVSNPDKIRYILAAMGSEPVPSASPVDYVRELFDKYALRFESHLVGKLDYRVPELLAAQLRPFVPAAPLDILDLGCGTGLCGMAMKPWARTLTGLDLSQKMLDEAARKQIYDRLVCGAIADFLPAQEAAFDLVVATDVFIYIGELATVFAAAHGALRADGLFAFSTESGETAEVELRESLRYAHSAAYIERLAREGRWRIEAMSAQVLRQEMARDMPGLVTVLRRLP